MAAQRARLNREYTLVSWQLAAAVLGAAFMAFVIIYTLAKGLLNGVQIGFGFGLAATGLLLSFAAQRVGKSTFYSDPTTSFGGRVEEEFARPRPS